jgi:hypothetical protein
VASRRENRSAMGVGVTTIVTVLVVLLLTAFAVLTLASARQDLGLSEIAVDAAADYYAADGEARSWYAGLAQATAGTSAEDRMAVLQAAGYQPNVGDDNSILVSKAFEIGGVRSLAVEVSIDAQGGLTVTRWQSVAKG